MKENLSLFESAPEIKPIDAPQNKKGKIDIPSDKKLLNSLKEIFNNEVGNGRETKPEAPDIENNPLEDKDSGKITLPDGTVIELPDTKEHEKVSRDDPDELFDDNGKQYRTEDGGWVPNNTYVLDEMTYKTDDNGNIYSVDGKLQPNTIYELNGNIYTTDEKGRIISCKAKPVRSPENPRDNEAQQQAGGEDRCPNDQGGHVVSRDMNGDGGIGNLVAMDSKINQSDYKRMENDIKTTLDEGKDVTTKTEMTYSGDSKRPDKITVTVGVDGEDTVYEFDNNLDGSMDNEISEKSPSAKVILDEHPDAHVSSAKREYDEDGNLIKTTAYITWTDENGNNRRSSIIVPND